MDVINIFILQFIKERDWSWHYFTEWSPFSIPQCIEVHHPLYRSMTSLFGLISFHFVSSHGPESVYTSTSFTVAVWVPIKPVFTEITYSLNVWCTCNVYPTYCFIININRLGLLITFWQHSSYSTTAKYGGGSYIWPWFTEMLTQKVKKT